ncbi:uncharacterized protein C9orf153 homolog isoform X1 [Mustela erminea]|uniref:uncharacterized protein C9orf153 homolog isoform X1 n=3 Tax=Mustela erminea TaxID=36723 RepID=UPI001386BA1F|nr:uncharacterized protein C9orf153 homolog isoform X1 [Mustela erminea]
MVWRWLGTVGIAQGNSKDICSFCRMLSTTVHPLLWFLSLGVQILLFGVLSYRSSAAASTKQTRIKQRSSLEPTPGIRGQSPLTMFLSNDIHPEEGEAAAESPGCSLPELYASVEDFIKESKKSNLPNTHGISPSKAQKMLSQNLNAMSISGTDDVREEDPQPLFVCEVMRREGEKPDSATEILYRSLLTPSLSPVERLTKSQQRLFRHGIPPPAHTFPYEILIEHSKSSSPVPVPVKEKTPGANTLGMLGISRIRPENFVFADRIAKYFLVDPEKQFMDLRDLEWRYYKGLTSWKHRTKDPFIDIKYDSEKRFVDSQQRPGVICPPVVCRSLFIYPQVDYPPKNSASS